MQTYTYLRRASFFTAQTAATTASSSFEIDPRTGKLKQLEHVSTEGKWPRNFTIDPSGRFLLVANQHTDNVVTFSIDRKTGRLKPTGQITEIPIPVCLKFLSRFL